MKSINLYFLYLGAHYKQIVRWMNPQPKNFKCKDCKFSCLCLFILKKSSRSIFTCSKYFIEHFDFELQDLILRQNPNVNPRCIRIRGYTTKAREYIFHFTHKGLTPYFKLASFESYHDGIFKSNKQ